MIDQSQLRQYAHPFEVAHFPVSDPDILFLQQVKIQE